MNLVNNLKGFYYYHLKSQTFDPNLVFKGKRLAVVGAANSALVEKHGSFIDNHDLVIRINKALISYDSNQSEFLGRKTDVLIHNFHENMDDGGGGPIDWEVFDRFELKYLLQAKTDFSGKRNVFNYYKKHLVSSRTIYLLPRIEYNRLKDRIQGYTPTRGFLGIYIALNSLADEVYLTGFTFFKTPYADGYRDNIQSVEATKKHMERQGFHNAELEYQTFKSVIAESNVKRITVDKTLFDILVADLGIDNPIFKKLGTLSSSD